MKSTRDPVRLAEETSDAPSFMRAAIDAARADLPDAERLERLSRRLPPGAAPPPGKGSSEPPLPPVAPAPTGVSGTAIGVVVAVLLFGGTALWTAFRGAPEPAAIESAASPELESATPPAGPPQTSDTAAPPEPSPAVADEPAPAASASAPRERRPEAPAASASAPAEVESEIRMLQRAQDALGSSPARALAVTNEHVARYPGGVLVQEREVIAISALVAMGRSGEARARVKRFLASFPRSAHRRRLEVLVGLDDSSHNDKPGAPPTP